MAATVGTFFRVETIGGDYGCGLSIYASWPTGLTRERAEELQSEISERFEQIESETNETT